jgi:phenylacetate-coenzyme A ligase PaaK-like adenylate-forming protein
MYNFIDSDINGINLKKYSHEALKIRSLKEFKAQTLLTFKYQYQNVSVYQKFVDYLGVDPVNVNEIEQIPFLPISIFKSHEVLSKNTDHQIVFKSSGTTGENRSQHFVHRLDVYQESFSRGFEWFYGQITDYTVLALLPSYLSQGESSLVYMFDYLIRASKNTDSGFYLDDYKGLVATLRKLDQQGKKVILLGVSYALLDVIEQFDLKLKNTIVMETGGMKGRRREMVKEELHQVLKDGFGVEKIHSEYGMTELLSQAYSKGEGVFETPPWMKVLIRDATDPLSLISERQTGGINVIDLSNHYSCSFIATQDLGKNTSHNTFEIIGRFDYTDVRGCNLLLV